MLRAAAKLVWFVSILVAGNTCAWLNAQGPLGPTFGRNQSESSTLPASGGPAVRSQPGNTIGNWPAFDEKSTDVPERPVNTVSPFGADAGFQPAPGGNAAGPVAPEGFPTQPNELEPFEPAQTIAQVGDQYILKGELIADANLLLFKEFTRLAAIPSEQQEQARSALLAERDRIVEQLLQLAIDRKLMYVEFRRTIPVLDEKKQQEQWKGMQKKVSGIFQKQLEELAVKVREADPKEYQAIMRQNYQLFRIALVMKEAGIESADDPRLERLLKENGTCIADQQQAFMERALGQEAIRGKVNMQPEITHDQMLAYYREHLAKFQVPTRARWEQLSVLFSRVPDKFQAGEAIKDMGNQVLFGGAQFWAVAKKHSQERNADKGGFHDWTALGDLKLSRALNDAIFTLPLNELSDIIIDEEGLHIVRVLEREQAHVIPFTEAQVEIKETLKQEMRNNAYTEYVAKLRQKTPVWTIYDDLGK